jgi:hypothetical protein
MKNSKTIIMQKGNTPKMKEPGKAGKIENATDQQDLQNELDNQEENIGTVEDGSPVLDEEDLEENDLSEEEADNIEWDEKEPGKNNPQKKATGNSGL